MGFLLDGKIMKLFLIRTAHMLNNQSPVQSVENFRHILLMEILNRQLHSSVHNVHIEY